MTKRSVRVSAGGGRLYDLTDNLADVIAMLQGILASIPKGFRKGATIDIDVDEDRGSSFYVTYWRPETTEEQNLRLANEDSERRAVEANERAEFEWLKEKYEG